MGSTMFSSAVSVASRLKLWKMKPILSRRRCVSFLSLSRVISMPSTATRPPVGLSRPARMCMRVDLPEPDGPMMAVRRPCGDVDVDVAQGVDRGVALAVGARDAAGGDDGPSLVSERLLQLREIDGGDWTPGGDDLLHDSSSWMTGRRLRAERPVVVALGRSIGGGPRGDIAGPDADRLGQRRYHRRGRPATPGVGRRRRGGRRGRAQARRPPRRLPPTR